MGILNEKMCKVTSTADINRGHKVYVVRTSIGCKVDV